MTTLTVRRLDPKLKERIRLRAARHGRSMEEEVRQILEQACAAESEPRNAFDLLRRHFVDLGGVDLELPPREVGRKPPDFA